MATSAKERWQKRWERIKADPILRAEYYAKKRQERHAHGPYPCESDPDYEGSRKRRWRQENAENNHTIRGAQWAVENAIKRGRLVRPDNCEKCGSGGRIEAHHDSYEREKWLDVNWLCRKCHGVADHDRRNSAKASEKG